MLKNCISQLFIAVSNKNVFGEHGFYKIDFCSIPGAHYCRLKIDENFCHKKSE